MRACRVKFEDGTLSDYLREADFLTSGLDEKTGREFERSQRRKRQGAVTEACAALPQEVRDALRQVKERVAQDKLPLFSLLQTSPFQFQASHLSLQEYYTAKAICDGRKLPPAFAAPWRWGVWWANTLRLGAEMGDVFGRGLLEASSCSAEHLDLKGKIGDTALQAQVQQQQPASKRSSKESMRKSKENIETHRPTALLAVAQLMRATKAITLTGCALTPEEGLRIAEGLRLSSCLTSLNLASNRLVGVWFEGGNFKGEYSREAIDAISLAVGGSQTLTMLDLSQNSLGVSYVSGVRVPSAQGIQAIADAASKAPALKRLGLAYNSIGATGGASIGTSFGTNKSLEELDISGNLIGHKGGRAVAEAMSLNAAFVSADLRHNSLDAETKQAVMQAAEKREGTFVPMRFLEL